MESTSRETLRRAVRRAVHHACWQRLEGDHELAHAEPHEEIARAREANSAEDVTDEEIRQWIIEDEAEFDRAVLISNLVARRVQRTAESAAEGAVAAAASAQAAKGTAPAAAAPARAETAEKAAPAREIVVRTPVRTAPSITALLDDMLAQQRAAASPRAAGA